jgi:membrane-associated phospholipid phosphatase
MSPALRTLRLSWIAAGLIPASVAAQELSYDLRLDVPIVVGGAAAWGGTELAKASLAPATCRWCDRDAEGKDTLNSLDRSARNGMKWDRTGIAATASDILAFGLVPLTAIGFDALTASTAGRADGIALDLLIVAEATVISANINQITKFIVGRERPFVHALGPDEKGQTARPADNNLSFYSGHTSITMTMGVAAGTVATLRGYPAAPTVWILGIGQSLAAGYLRIAADKHYLTDVLTGALVGGAVGFLVPYAFHRPGTNAPTATVGTNLVGFHGVW